MTFIMQNKPNLLKRHTNVTSTLTKDYENKPPLTLCENKPNSNPTCSELACTACPERAQQVEGSIVEVSNPIHGYFCQGRLTGLEALRIACLCCVFGLEL